MLLIAVDRRFTTAIALLGCGGAALVLTPAATVLLTREHLSLRARLLGLVLLMLLAALVMVVGALHYRGTSAAKAPGRVATGLLISVVFCISVLGGRERAPDESSIRSVHLVGSEPPLALDRLLSEADQVELLQRSEAREHYEELSRSAEFSRLESALPYAYAEQLGARNNGLGHLFAIFPDVRCFHGARVLIVIHGAGGNLHRYIDMFRAYSREMNSIVLLPTAGWGTDRYAQAAAIEHAVHYSLELGADHENITLAALGTGAEGAVSAVQHRPSSFSRVMFFAPVFHNPYLRDSSWSGLPVFIAGSEAEHDLERSSARVTHYVLEDSAFFADRHQEAIAQAIEWLKVENNAR